jgi:endonuclease/exonuclease/phosphatase family metal-dependent hydrolase
MATVFSFASWNVEHFKGRDVARAQRCVQFIRDQNPDVFGIYEVEGKDVFDHFVNLMPSHNIYVTEGLSYMQTLIGVRRSITAFVTQRHSFKSKVPTLRPGTLVTIQRNGTNYSLLFLHIKSLPDPRSWGLRDDMVKHVKNLKSALDRNAGNAANLIAIGDFNTMGLNVTYADNDMTGVSEVARYERVLARGDMRWLPKSKPHTWWNGPDGSYDPSDLDHVFASDHLLFKDCGSAQLPAGAEVAAAAEPNPRARLEVRGWPEMNTDAQKQTWINRYSDHALLFGKVMTG